MSLRLLRAFNGAYVSGIDRNLTTRQVVDKVVKNITAMSEVRLLDMLDESCAGEVGPPQYLVSHCWSR